MGALTSKIGPQAFNALPATLPVRALPCCLMQCSGYAYASLSADAVIFTLFVRSQPP